MGGVDPSDGPQSFVLIDGRAESIQQHDWGFPGVGGVDPSDGPQVIVAEGAAWDLNRSDRQTPSAGYDLASEDGLCFPEDMLRQETAGLEVTGSCRNSDGGDSPSILGQANGKTENILIDTVGGLDVGSALGGAYVEAADSFFAGWPGSVVDPSDCPRVVYSDDGPLIMNTGLADHFVGDDDLWLTGNGEANPVDGYFAGITAEGPMEELSGSIIRRNGIENDGAQD